LREGRGGEKALLHAIAEHEASLREYAFAAVADSLKADKAVYWREDVSRLFELQDWYARGKCHAEVEEQIDSCVDDCTNGSWRETDSEYGDMMCAVEARKE
jgi:hypothetical protein